MEILSAEDLRNIFTYHAPRPDQLPRYERLRGAAHAFAVVLVESVRPCADRSAALRKIREAVMTGNQAIALEPETGVSVASSVGMAASFEDLGRAAKLPARSIFDRSKPWMHWSGGLHFQRQADGSVTIAQCIGPDHETVAFEATIPADEWVSLLAHLSARRETPETWRLADELHMVVGHRVVETGPGAGHSEPIRVADRDPAPAPTIEPADQPAPDSHTAEGS